MTTSVKTSSIRLFIQVIVLSFMLTLSLLAAYHLWGTSNNSRSTPLSAFHQTQTKFEANIAKNLQQMLAQVVGYDAVKVSVHADIDFEEQQVTKEFLNASDPMEQAKKDENFYGFLKQTTQSSTQAGRVKRLSVAVLLDSSKTFYTREQKDQIRDVIYSTIGFDAFRGDTVEIQSMPFVRTPIWQNPTAQTVSVFILIVVLVVCFGCLCVKNMALTTHLKTLPAISHPDFVNKEILSRVHSATQINGQVQAHTLNDVQNLIQENPAEVLTVLRSWLCQEDENDF